ncbi:MAG: FeoB-associated Cys-rich membrane protein [Treponema sp.]|uniref:FeoB-associated Cys-rich membrane protein n=1 Tax=Treponema ruminis TaxID=744515 RepID=A0A7W8LL16_9SPIR|nr:MULTISPECIES: FeoB-associated Cys-rich membrane protein [Treponema]MBB5224941.1 hypothetical protein [Treponema ruminis]MDY6398197.1 FeoB-associated Cys-rich membrane protein [Treponema sp.]
MGNIIVGSILLVVVAAVIVRLIKNKLSGKSSCSCGCGGGSCPHCAGGSCKTDV